jgi:hypothetical protein
LEKLSKAEAGEPLKHIDGTFFDLHQYVEVRGDLRSSSDLFLEEFTDFGEDMGTFYLRYLDLRQYNKTLALMISNAEHFYY